jgi:hypothetical protein
MAESAFEQRARELRKLRDEIHERDKAHYGEEEYQRRERAKQAVVEGLYLFPMRS